MKVKKPALRMVPFTPENSLKTNSVRRWDKEAGKNVIDDTPTAFVENSADGWTYEAIAFDDKKAVILILDAKEVEVAEEVKPAA